MNDEPCDGCKRPDRSMDDCYNQMIERLTIRGKVKEVSITLASLLTNYERVLYIYSVVKDIKFLPIVKVNKKDNLVSVYFRFQGNDYFKQKDYYEAWQSYNLSFLYAESKSENFIYAVSNRSAVFFAMEKYHECLKDIHFVFSTQFPEKIRMKLLERKKQCLARLAEIENSDEYKNKVKENERIDAEIADILGFKGTKDKKYVSASSKLKVVYTKQMGRHVVANEDIEVGEVLVQEDPYLILPLKTQLLFCCSYCISRSMNLYPCLNCTYTMYCSVECREHAFNKYHCVECPLLPSLISMDFTKLEWMAIRTLLRTRTDHENWKQMFKTVNEAESTMYTDNWGCVKIGDNWVYDSKYYKSIHTLATNVEVRTISDLFRKSLTAAVLTHFLSVLNFLKSDDFALGENAKKYVAGTILRHIMIGPTNMHSISSNIANAQGKFVDDYHIACGAYAFLSLLNHSCNPNVVRYTKLGTSQMMLFAIRPIKKGMQIFDNYGYHYAIQERDSRQSNLKFQYKFNCACEACVDDWPLHADLPSAKGLPLLVLMKKQECLSADVIEKLMTGDRATAVKYYRPLCELITLLDPFAPCKELAECQEAMKQCLVIFHGVVPYEYTKVVPWRAFPPCSSVGGPPHLAPYVSGPAL